LLPPAASMIRTLRRSERRNMVLSELAKYQEHVRERTERLTSRPDPDGK